MGALPRTFEDSLQQMAVAVQLATGRGRSRMLIEFKMPQLDILALIEPLALVLPAPVLFMFPDAGAAALALKRLGSQEGVTLKGIGAVRDLESYASFVLLQTSLVEVVQAEKLANQAAGRPYVFVNPLLSAGAVGIGLAGRQMRSRFLSTLEPVYHLEPLDEGALLRAYPENWQVWRETAGEYQLVSERGQRPTLEELNAALVQKSTGLFGELGRLLRALGR
ncbi:DUF1995 family protein [Anthocerotibacter panamensis]|uniref:DUF1995 family protein n=1 Tax=Anthocerotibacter panamensis TaxID=2857077 RepID=UPI001C401ACA|nr:DUF1995 family protein [Anthocerotibacter panamensis]